MAQATFQIDYDDEVGFAARRWLFDYARNKSSGKTDDAASPFAMVASFIHPHDPYVARPEWWNLYTDDQIDLPEYPLTAEQQDPFSRRVMDGIEASTVELTDEEIIRARRAYFANVSYFDSKIGLLTKTLEETGELDNTIVIVTADHGDMLGERGLWYKMNFFEHSARIPLVMAGPGITTGSVSNACSLVDMLPTMIDIGGGDDSMLGEPIDGRSLLNLAQGNKDQVDEAIGEYCAEMTPCPVFMIRRGSLKYIHCDFDPPQLYDLSVDPMEKTNLANDPAFAGQAQSFAEEVANRWDSEALRTSISTGTTTHPLTQASNTCAIIWTGR